VVGMEPIDCEEPPMPADAPATLLPMLERRRIEAAILKHVYDTLKASHGIAVAQRTIADAVRSSSIEQGREFAAKAGGQTSMGTFVGIQDQWRMSGALEVDVKAQSDTRFDFNVTRCRYAEMYREMGLGEIGHLLSCQRDATFCEGYDDRLKLTRTQTIMQGASHCDFSYRLETDAGPYPKE
jgi:L-2-amino-thiazoline-4-carboxylic acid hydrolase